MAWRGDDLEAEAKVNVHVLVDCLSSTVRGAQVHAGSGCSVVILLASAPQASALGPSVHELRVLQAVGTRSGSAGAPQSDSPVQRGLLRDARHGGARQDDPLEVEAPRLRGHLHLRQ